MKPIIGDRYVYKAEKNDNKKFCSQICCNEYYAPNCAECGKKAILGLHKSDKNDGKKFCGTTCMNKHYDKETKQQVSDFWQKYKSWIIGGGVGLVLLIILGVVFSGSKKKKGKKR
jgi:hypothetical protein